MYREVAVAVSHGVTTLHVGVKFALRVNANMVTHELVLKHEMFDSILFSSGMVLTHEQGVVRHYFEDPTCEGGAAEEGAAGIDALVILRDQDVDFLYAEVLRAEDIRRVLLQLAVEDWCVSDEALLDRRRRKYVVCKGDFRVHYDNVGINQPDPFSIRVDGESFGNGGNFGPCLRETLVSTTVACAV